METATGSRMDSDLILIDQFVAITGANRDVAVTLLEACAGNLDMAIGMHIDGGDGSASNSASGAVNIDRCEDDVRAPIPQKTEVLVDDSNMLSGVRIRRPRPRLSVFDGFRDFQSETYLYDQQSSKSSKSSKKRSLEDLFRPPVDITFKGTFQNARDAGSAQNKWLLVNVQNVQEFACQMLNRDVWSCQNARSLIGESFIFWQVYSDSSEGKWFMQFYKLTQWPYVAVVDPFTGEKQVVWHRITDGPVFCELVKEFLSSFPVPDQWSTSSGPKRFKKDPSILDATEQEQMEAAIRASLTEEIKKDSPQYVLDSDSDNEGNSDDVETFSDSDDIVVPLPLKSLSANKSNTQVSSLTSSSSAASSNNSRPSPRKGLSRSKQRPSLSRAVTISSSSSSSSPALSSGNIVPSIFEDHARLPLSTGASSQISRDRGVDDRNDVVSRWTSESSPQLGINGILDTNIESSLIDMIGCREAEVSTPEPYLLGDSPSCSQTSTPEVEPTKESSDYNHMNSQDRKAGSEHLISSCWTDFLGSPADPMSKILIRFPDNRKEHVELPCTSQLKALTLFCSGHGFPADKFELVTNYPRRRLSQLVSSLSLQEAGLHLQETIFVQDL